MNNVLFFSFLFLAFFSCSPPVNKTFVGRFTDTSISSEGMIKAKEEIENRLGNIKAMNSKVELDLPKKEITVQSTNRPNPDLERTMKSIFKKSKFEIRPTYRVFNSGLNEYLNALPEIDGFTHFSDSDYSENSNVLGYVNSLESSERILKILNQYFDNVKNLEVKVSQTPMRNGLENEGLYPLHLVNMSADKNPVFQTSITGSKLVSNESDSKKHVMVTFDHQGSKDFAEMTKVAAAQNRNTIAMILNNKVICAPHVNSPIFGGMVAIIYDAEEPKIQEMADILRMGPLSYDLEIVK